MKKQKVLIISMLVFLLVAMLIPASVSAATIKNSAVTNIKSGNVFYVNSKAGGSFKVKTENYQRIDYATTSYAKANFTVYKRVNSTWKKVDTLYLGIDSKSDKYRCNMLKAAKYKVVANSVKINDVYDGYYGDVSVSTSGSRVSFSKK